MFFKRRLGLALGSGSSRGLAHIGLIKLLEKHKIPIDYISGSSIGAVFAALYAAGMSGEELEELVIDFVENPPVTISVEPFRAFIIFIKSVLHRFFPVDWIKTPRGFIDWQPIYCYLERLLGRIRFDQLDIPLMVTSTDLITGEGIAFIPSNYIFKVNSLNEMVFYHNQRVVDAVISSILIPGIFLPFIYGERILVDGGVKNSVPVDLLTLYRPDLVIGVDLGFANQADDMVESPLAAAFQTLDIMGQEIADLNLQKYADIVIKPQLQVVDIKNIADVKNAIEAGRKAGETVLPDIKRMLWR